jgi:hypothetical protein
MSEKNMNRSSSTSHETSISCLSTFHQGVIKSKTRAVSSSSTPSTSIEPLKSTQDLSPPISPAMTLQSFSDSDHSLDINIDINMEGRESLEGHDHASKKSTLK